MGSLNVPIGDPEWSRSHVPTQGPGGRSFLTAVERSNRVVKNGSVVSILRVSTKRGGDDEKTGGVSTEIR